MKVFKVLGVVVGSFLVMATAQAADVDSVMIDNVVLGVCGQQQVNITGTGTYSEPTQHLVVTLDGVELFEDNSEPANWSTGLQTVAVGNHTVIAAIYDNNNHVDLITQATMAFTVASCDGGNGGGSANSGSGSNDGNNDDVGPDCCPGPDPEPVVKKTGQVKGTTIYSSGDLSRIKQLNSLFRQAYGRNPTFAEWKHWADRFFTEGKFWSSGKAKVGTPRYDVWLGAMQWQAAH